MSLNSDIKFQKALALAASASNQFEAKAAELAARRLMATYNIDPTDIPDRSLHGRIHFTDNALLKKLRDEWREAHPKAKAKRVNTKSKPASVNTSKPKDVNTSPFANLSFEDFEKEPVNTKRNRDRHSPGYMRDYMRRYRKGKVTR